MEDLNTSSNHPELDYQEAGAVNQILAGVFSKGATILQHARAKMHEFTLTLSAATGDEHAIAALKNLREEKTN